MVNQKITPINKTSGPKKTATRKTKRKPTHEDIRKSLDVLPKWNDNVPEGHEPKPFPQRGDMMVGLHYLFTRDKIISKSNDCCCALAAIGTALTPESRWAFSQGAEGPGTDDELLFGAVINYFDANYPSHNWRTKGIYVFMLQRYFDFLVRSKWVVGYEFKRIHTSNAVSSVLEKCRRGIYLVCGSVCGTLHKVELRKRLNMLDNLNLSITGTELTYFDDKFLPSALQKVRSRDYHLHAICFELMADGSGTIFDNAHHQPVHIPELKFTEIVKRMINYWSVYAFQLNVSS